MNVVSQFYWSHNLILFSFVIRDSKRWKKKGIYYFQLKLKNWISHLSQQTAASEQWDYVYVGIKTIVEYKHALKQKGIKTLSAGTQSSKYWSVWKKKKKTKTNSRTAKGILAELWSQYSTSDHHAKIVQILQ